MATKSTAATDALENEKKPPEEGAEGAETVPAKPRSAFMRKLIDAPQKFKTNLSEFIWSREPHPVPTVTTAMAVILLMCLGFWQLQRLEWKNAMIQQIETQLSGKNVDMRAHFPQNDAEWRNYNFRSVILKGTWLSLHGFKMIPRTYEGQVGYHLILPLKLQNNQIIFVNRGFVPDNAAILPPSEEKVFAVQGVLRIPESRKAWATPENIPSRGVWTWADLAAMRHEIGVNSAAPVILYETRTEAQDSYPIGGQLPVPFYNRHRQYAMTWFALAIAFMGIWMIASSPREKLKPTEEPVVANDDTNNDPVARRGLYPEATD